MSMKANNKKLITRHISYRSILWWTSHQDPKINQNDLFLVRRKTRKKKLLNWERIYRRKDLRFFIIKYDGYLKKQKISTIRKKDREQSPENYKF